MSVLRRGPKSDGATCPRSCCSENASEGEKHCPELARGGIHIIAGLWILNALLEILQGSGLIPSFTASPGFREFLIVMGVIDLILGIGMWVQNDLAMTIVKWRCIWGLIQGFLGFLMAFAYTGSTAMVVVIIVFNTLYLAFTGFQLYILSMFSD